MSGRWAVLAVAAVVGLGGCATIPTGPSVMVLPGAGKSFEQFQADNAVCRDWASQQIGTTSTTAAAQSTAGTAAIGTVLGAGLGAAIGAASGHPGTGAAIGAGSGALGGTAMGADAGQASGREIQRRYDIAYQQCMYAKGNQIPGVVRAPQPGHLVPVPPPPAPGAAPGSPASPPSPGVAPPQPAPPH
jgi:hypothetical protein